jgi:hypothetical protein
MTLKPLDDLTEHDVSIVRQMLRAVVEHPQIYVNRIHIRPQKKGRNDLVFHRFEYYVGRHNSQSPSPISRNFYSENNIGEYLLALGYVTKDRNEGWYNFTPEAMDWYRQPEPVTDQEVQHHLGEYLLERFHEGEDYLNPRPIDFAALAQDIGVPLDRLLSHARLLIRMGFMTEGAVQGEGLEDGYLLLTDHKGLPWANAGAGPISADGNPIINVTVQITLNQVIEQVEALDLPQETKDQVELLLRRFDGEKQKGRPSYKPIQDLLDMAGNVKEVAPTIIRFLGEHADDIERAIRSLPGIQ